MKKRVRSTGRERSVPGPMRDKLEERESRRKKRRKM